MKNLVLGAAKSYGWDILEPFVTSCKMNCPDAQIVLFVDDISDFTRDRLIRAGVTLENFPAVKGIPNNTRWKIISDYLDRHGDDYANVFVADTRDVIFQGDIFAAFDDCQNWLAFANEDDVFRNSKSGDPTNYNWLVSFFGKTEADKLADQKIICSGTIIGSLPEMKIFCRELWRILEPKVSEEIFDQAVTNWLVYNGRIPVENIFEIVDEGGEIFTAGLFVKRYAAKIRDGLILRCEGSVPAVVHQYDRSGNLILLVDKLYRDRNFAVDKRFTDTRSLLEQVISLLYADKIVEATRLLLKIFVATVNFDIYVDALTKIWELALRKTPSPTVEMLELAAQNSLNNAQRFSDIQLFDIKDLFVMAANNGHAVDREFRNNFASRLCNSAEHHLAAGNGEAYSTCKKLLDELTISRS